MGVYYRWLCDEKREYFDPGELLGPKCLHGGYGIKANSIPYSAWVVGALMTDRWSGCGVRLVNDGGDDYDCDGYEDVHQYVLRNLLHMAPDEGLRFLAREVRRIGLETAVEEQSERLKDNIGERNEYLKILTEYARDDWPERCKEENCLEFGTRHSDDHVFDSPMPEPEYVRRQYIVGLGRGEALAGEEVVLTVEMTSDFRMDRLVLGEDTSCFVMLRISVAGEDVPIVSDVSAATVEALGGLPVRCEIKTCQKIEVVLRNVSDGRAKIVGSVMGTVLTKNPKWSSNG